MEIFDSNGVSRRSFLKGMAGMGGALLAAGCAGGAMAAGGGASTASFAQYRARPGIQIYTVRDHLATDFEGAIAQLAQIGYRDLELVGPLPGTPQQVRAIFDRHGVTAVSTHISARVGPDLDRTLEGYAVMGHRYTAAAGPAPAAPATPPAAPAAGAAAPRPGPTRDSIMRQAEVLNQVGMAGKKYGIKALIHNHTNEFEPLAEDRSVRPYDILLAETDPSLVAMELDIGWATVAGQDALAMFRKNPGRFELWHVKDMDDLSALAAMTTQAERQRAAKIVPVGAGDIDYRPIFAAAGIAGMKHYFVEQDTAPNWAGGSYTAAKLSYDALMRTLA